jgi:hypothetical protein
VNYASVRADAARIGGATHWRFGGLVEQPFRAIKFPSLSGLLAAGCRRRRRLPKYPRELCELRLDPHTKMAAQRT